MRPALLSAALLSLVLVAPSAALAQEHTCSIAPSRLCHSASAAPTRHRHLRASVYRHLSRYGQAYHIPRFNQAEAEAEVHTVYPYRTGVYAPWPDFYGTPYYPPYPPYAPY